jgi:hypothetical protein
MHPIRFPLIAILLLALCGSAAAAQWTISGAVANDIVAMAAVVGLGTAIGIAIAVLSYYAAIMTNDERNKVGAVSEMKSTLINLFIFAFVLGAIVSIDGFFGVLALDSSGDMATAITNLYKGNIDYLMPIARQAVGVYSDASQASASSSSISGYLDLPGGFKISTNVGRASTIPILERLSEALSQLTITIVSICGQQAMMANLMRYFVVASCQLLLPFGFFLRAIPYVRRAGSTLVAIGITLTLIYPIALFFLGSILFGVQEAAIYTTFGSSGFAPEEYDVAMKAMGWAGQLRGMATTYEITGNILVIMNVFVKGTLAMIAAVLTAFFGLGQALAAVFKTVMLIANFMASYQMTFFIFDLHNDMINDMRSFFLGAGMADAVDLEYNIAVFGTIVNMTHVLLMAGVALTVIGGIRSLAILLGGEFFLYGLTDYI